MKKLLLSCAIAAAIAPALSGQAQAMLIDGLALSSVDGLPWTFSLLHYQPGTPVPYLVSLQDQPIALYDGSIQGLARPPQRAARGVARSGVDVRSREALAYESYLNTQHDLVVSQIRLLLARPLGKVARLKHAANALVIDLTRDEAARIQSISGVGSISAARSYAIQTDLGPQLIGAPAVWSGAYTQAADTLFAEGFDGARAGASRGEGMIVGIVDSGINPESPSFAASDDGGYVFTNPYGSGVYLGQCAPGGMLSPQRCNSKLLGIYDFVPTLLPNLKPGIDQNGHGSHVASIAAGNSRSAQYYGINTRISGVAPHSHIVSYRVCDENGACLNTAMVAAFNQAILDGVDVVNMSISGGMRPWNDALSDSFRAATAAGIIVATAAGNTSSFYPEATPGTVNSAAPWVMTAAASTHSGGEAPFHLVVQGEQAPAPIEATIAPAQTATVALPPTAFSTSQSYGLAGDGCSAFAAGTFQGRVALLQYSGSCPTATMAQNAEQAGAAAIVIANNVDSPFASGATTATLVFTVSSSAGQILKDYAANTPTASLAISLPSARRSNVADRMGDFSLLGPTPWAFLKPDITMPGVSILAAYKASAAQDDVLAIESGTSMAAPHLAGAALLLKSVHPTWTPMEVKSALMMSARIDGVMQPDGQSPADVFARGAGRGQVDQAIRVGLVMDEDMGDFATANPTLLTSVLPVSQLNLPAIVDSNFIHAAVGGPTFYPRTLRNVADHAVTYTISTASGSETNALVFPQLKAISFRPRERKTVYFTSLVAPYDTVGTYQVRDTVVLTPDDPSLAVLHVPVALDVPPGRPELSARSLTISIPPGQNSATGTVDITNRGGKFVHVQALDHAEPGTVFREPLIDNKSFGFDFSLATFEPGATYQNPVTFQNFSAGAGTISRISADFFTAGDAPGAAYDMSKFHFWIYADDGNGAPAGSPVTGTGAAPLWHAEISMNAPELSLHPVPVDGARQVYSVTLDTLAMNSAAAPPALPPGRYWLGIARQGSFAQAAATGKAFSGWLTAVEPNALPARTNLDLNTGLSSESTEIAVTSSPSMSALVEEAFECAGPVAGISAAANELPIQITAYQSAPIALEARRSDFPAGQNTVEGTLCVRVAVDVDMQTSQMIYRTLPIRVKAIAQ